MHCVTLSYGWIDFIAVKVNWPIKLNSDFDLSTTHYIYPPARIHYYQCICDVTLKINSFVFVLEQLTSRALMQFIQASRAHFNRQLCFDRARVLLYVNEEITDIFVLVKNSY